MYHQGAIYIANGRGAEGEKLVTDALELNPAFDATESKEALALVVNRGVRRKRAAGTPTAGVLAAKSSESESSADRPMH
jgi:hypothetical protein